MRALDVKTVAAGVLAGLPLLACAQTVGTKAAVREAGRAVRPGRSPDDAQGRGEHGIIKERLRDRRGGRPTRSPAAQPGRSGCHGP